MHAKHHVVLQLGLAGTYRADALPSSFRPGHSPIGVDIVRALLRPLPCTLSVGEASTISPVEAVVLIY